jgi:hypothetical protein
LYAGITTITFGLSDFEPCNAIYSPRGKIHCVRKLDHRPSCSIALEKTPVQSR